MLYLSFQEKPLCLFYSLPTFLFIFCLSFFLIICYFLFCYFIYLDQLLVESTLPLLILPIFTTRVTDRQSSRHCRENVFKPHVGPFWACGFGGTEVEGEGLLTG